MAKAVKGGGKLQCSFCGKSQDDVRKLIAGPTVYICDECIELCNDIIAEEWEQEKKSKVVGQLPKPSEIKTFLDHYVVGQERGERNHERRVLVGGEKIAGPRRAAFSRGKRVLMRS